LRSLKKSNVAIRTQRSPVYWL